MTVPAHFISLNLFGADVVWKIHERRKQRACCSRSQTSSAGLASRSSHRYASSSRAGTLLSLLGSSCTLLQIKNKRKRKKKRERKKNNM
jgi:hypothetical protein